MFWNSVSVMWLLCLAAATGCTVTLCLSTWERYRDHPTVISLQNNYRDWNTSLMSAYICPLEKIDNASLYELSEKLANSTHPRDVDHMRRFLETLAYLNYKNLSSIKDFRRMTSIPSSDYNDIVEKISFKFSYAFSDATAKVAKGPESDDESDEEEEEEKADTNDIGASSLDKILTDFGICYAHNSQIAVKFNNRTAPVLVGSFLKPGIFRTVNKINGDVVVYFEGAKEIPAMGKLNNVVMNPMMHYSTMDLAVISVYATSAVRQLDVDHRKCRFWEESDLAISPVYSSNLCRSQCRADLAKSLCGCVPFFQVGIHVADYKICDVEGMLCLANHSESLIFVDGDEVNQFSCNCYPTCEGDDFSIVEKSTKGWQERFGGTSLRWYVSNYPTIRMKRDVLFTLPDMLVAFGGTAGFFLGCSVLSIVEVFYFLTLRLFFYLRDEHDLRKLFTYRRKSNITQPNITTRPVFKF